MSCLLLRGDPAASKARKLLFPIVILLFVQWINLTSASKLLLVVFDGTGHRYAGHKNQIPAFQYLQDNGVRAKYMRPPFPTYTAPCHETLATGLYVESHGVITNCKMDLNKPPPGSNYYPTYLDDEWWDKGGEPIWITAVKQGLKSGGHHFPGSYVKIGGRTATMRVPMTAESVTTEEGWRRYVDEFMSWFTEHGLDVVMAYFPHPDNLSHLYGPSSSIVADETMSKVNKTIFYLLEKVKESGLKDELDIIVTSDHGLTEVDTNIPAEEAISVLKHVNADQLDYLYCIGTNGFIEPKPGHLLDVYGKLKTANLKMDVYLKDELPERWHFKHERVTSIFLVAHKGHKIYEMFPGYHSEKGQHGYDNNISDMWAIFFAIGPSFKKNLTIEGFDSIHVYSLMTHLLGLNPAPNNGSLEVLAPILVTERQPQVPSLYRPSTWLAVFFACLVLVTVVSWRQKITGSGSRPTGNRKEVTKKGV